MRDIKRPISILGLSFLVWGLSQPCIYGESPASPQAEPVAQIYEVRGEVMIKGKTGAESSQAEPGTLLGPGDVLYLGENSETGIYFKDGGKKQVAAGASPAAYSVADLVPKPETYDRTFPQFGGTRAPTGDGPAMAMRLPAFAYPRETLIIGAAPVLEWTVFNTGTGAGPVQAEVHILENDQVLLSEQFDHSSQGASSHSFSADTLAGGKEYALHMKLRMNGAAAAPIVYTTNFYVAQPPEAAAGQHYRPFADSAYRSLEYSPVHQDGRQYDLWFAKELKFAQEESRPVIAIEVFIQ